MLRWQKIVLVSYPFHVLADLRVDHVLGLNIMIVMNC